MPALESSPQPVENNPTPSSTPAPNPFSKSLSEQPTGQSTSGFTPSGPPPIGDDGGSGKKKYFIIAGIAVALLALIILIPTTILTFDRNQKRYTPTPTPLPANNVPQVDPAARSDLKQQFFLKATTTTRTAYDLTVTVPTAWSTSFSTAPTADYPWESSLLATALVTRFSPLSSANPSAPAKNYLAIIDISDWLTNDKNKIPFPAATKQGWYATLRGITAETAASAGASLPNPRAASEPGGRQKITYISTKDKQLHGISYLTLFSDKGYDPQQVTMMAGVLDKRNVVIYGVQGVRDKRWSELLALQTSRDPSFNDQLNQAITAFKAGTISDDAQAIQKEMLESINTIVITRTGQEAGTVQ